MKYQILEIIKGAALKRNVLRIIYIEKDGTSEGWRYVEPYSLSHDQGQIGLFAWDKNKNGIRRFSIDRIDSAEITSEIFTPRYNIEIQ